MADRITGRSAAPTGGSGSPVERPAPATPPGSDTSGARSGTIDVSVIVPFRDAEDTIAEALAGLAVQDFEGTWELILVDNGSTDGSVAIASAWRPSFPRSRLVRAPSDFGSGHARNVGVRAAAADRLAFCDADDVVAPGWLSAIVAALDRYPIVGGRRDYDLLNPPGIREMRDPGQVDDVQRWEAPPYWVHVSSSNMAVRRDVFEALGGFGAVAVTLPDTELCFRANLAGYEIGFAPDALVHLRFRPSLRGGFEQARAWGVASVYLTRRFRRHGLRAARRLQAIGGWLLLAPRLIRVRSRGELARWLWLLGWKVGRVQGSLRYRQLAP